MLVTKWWQDGSMVTAEGKINKHGNHILTTEQLYHILTREPCWPHTDKQREWTCHHQHYTNNNCSSNFIITPSFFLPLSFSTFFASFPLHTNQERQLRIVARENIKNHGWQVAGDKQEHQCHVTWIIISNTVNIPNTINIVWKPNYWKFCKVIINFIWNI